MKISSVVWIVIGVVVVAVTVFGIVRTQQGPVFEEATIFPTDFGDGSVPEVSTDPEPYMEGVSGGRVSTVGLVEHPAAAELTEGFFQVTTDPERYDIFYNNGNKNIFILLYQEPLGFVRSLAETELRAALQVDEAALCDLGIQVRTNEFVNPEYAAFNLGLSFCPGSISLENI